MTAATCTVLVLFGERARPVNFPQAGGKEALLLSMKSVFKDVLLPDMYNDLFLQVSLF